MITKWHTPTRILSLRPNPLNNFNCKKSALRGAAFVLVALSFFQLPASAQRSQPEITRNGATAVVGLARGERLRFSAFNPSTTESSRENNEPVRMQLKLYDANGNVIAQSPDVEIPPGEFRFVDFNRDDLPIAGEPGTQRAQFRTQALWGLRAHGRLQISTSLEIIDNQTGGSFKFFFTVEALP